MVRIHQDSNSFHLERCFERCMDTRFKTSVLLPLIVFFSLISRLFLLADIPQHPLTIAELVDISLQNHPLTKKAWWNARCASEAVGVAQSEYYPHLDVEGEVTHQKERKFINGPDTECTTYGADLVLSMMLYDFGKTRAAVESAKKRLQAASWDEEMSIQKVLVGVFGSAYEMLHAQEVYEESLLSLKETEKMFEAAQELNRVGLKPIFDVYSSKAHFIQAKMEVRAKKAALLMSEAQLLVSLGLQSAQLTLLPVDINDVPKKSKIDQLVEYSHKQRADLLSKQAAYEAALFDVEKEKNRCCSS